MAVSLWYRRILGLHDEGGFVNGYSENVRPFNVKAKKKQLVQLVGCAMSNPSIPCSVKKMSSPETYNPDLRPS